MNLKKLMALLVVFVMLFSLGLVVEAEEGVEIISPTNGAMIEYTEEETELVISSNEGMTLQIYFDGERLDNVETVAEETKINLGVLELGGHKISIVAISGTASYTADSAFSVVQTVTKENYYDTFAGGNSGSLAPYSSKPSFGKDENGDDIPAFYGSFPGVDNDEDGSIGFRFMKTAQTITLPDGAEICYVMEPLPSGLNSKFSLEYDLMLLNPGAWEIRVGNSQSGSRKYSQLAVSQFLNDDGYVAGTDIVYPVDEWMHIKHEVNVLEGKSSVYINDTAVLVDINVGKANLENLEIIKFQYYPIKPQGPQGFNLDNVRIASQSMYGGISATKYVLEDGTEKEISDSVITDKTKKIIFNNDVEGFTPWTKGTKFSVLANGVEVPVSSIKSNGGNTFSVEFLNPLPEKAHIEVYTEYNSFPIKTFFDTNSIGFGIYEVSFRQGKNVIYSSDQIESGTNLVCFLSVKTNYEEDKTVMAVVGIYSGNRLVALQTKSGIKINGNTTAIRQKSVNINVPENIEDISVEVFLIDELSTRRPLSYPFVLGK